MSDYSDMSRSSLIIEIDRLVRDARNDAIAYKAVIERQEELRESLRQLKAENESLRSVAYELRSAVECGNVDHCKAEQHELGEPCKVLARIDAAMGQGEQS